MATRVVHSLQQLPMEMGFQDDIASKLLSIFFLSVISSRLGLAAVHDQENYARRQLVDDIPGFMSIDCGALEDSINERSGIPYKSDKDLTTSGISKQISLEFYGNLSEQYRNLRSFPQGIRNCYTLKPKAGGKNSYLIRATFVYGNYDGKNLTPIFDLYLGVNFWATVQLSQVVYEVIIVPSTDQIDVCLINTGKGVPYISTLELRQLDNSLYQVESGQPLFLWFRYDVGGKNRIRYPHDVYDRFWEPLPCDVGSNDLISTNASISTSNDDPYKLPQAMLQTACQAPNSSSSLTGYWPGSFQFYFCFYFAEFLKLDSSQIREMSLIINGVHVIAPSIKLEYLKSRTVCSKGLLLFPEQENKCSLSATSNSSLPPLMNGFESFYSLKTSNSSTFLQDINAIMDIKHEYKVDRNWQGDPCNPTRFLWDGLNCSNDNPSRIISLNLSQSGLAGEIAISLSNLTALESLDLSYNKLTGSIPESLAQLPHLRILNLARNEFTGGVPNALLQKSKDGTLDLSYSKLCLSPPCKKKRKFSVPFLASIIPALILLILLGILVVIFKGKRKEKIDTSKKSESVNLNSRQLNYLDIVSITENFKTVIGGGGFGKVYLGALKDGTFVAVKLLSSSSKQGYREFQAEAKLQMIVNHRNLVSLIGYCDDGDNKALIYEYMVNGNLQQHLSEKSTEVLSWRERLHIALDAAQGLEYLHNGCKPPIIHRDVKTTNILLNDKMQAKIADLGLSRCFPSETDSHLSTRPAGTFGYIDPEIHSSGNYTRKSDVYSFGIVLFELITGRPAIISGNDDNVHILSWVKAVIKDGNIEDIIDSRLRAGAIENRSASKAVEVAVSCTLPISKERPDMGFVVMELVECLKMAQNKTGQMTSESLEMYSYTSIGSELSVFEPR